MTYAVLKITDGTSINTINLLSPSFGYILCDWRPARPELELVMNRNWFSGIETPASVVQRPIIDTMIFNARHNDVDRLILDEQKLNRILYMANLYWTGDRAVHYPFYFVAKNKDETGLRYSTIFSAQLHDDSNPYTSPFFTHRPASVGLTVPTSHSEWIDHPPGKEGVIMYESVTSVLNSTVTGKNQGIHFLNDQARIMLSNMLSHNGITHIFNETPDVNFINEPEYDGYNLFAGTSTSHTTYFGMEVKDPVTAPSGYAWPGIHFNITTPATKSGGGDPEFTWEIWMDANPGGPQDLRWVTILVEDGTKGLTEPGTVLFSIPGFPFKATTIKLIDGFWVRVNPVYQLQQIPAVSIKHPAPPVLPYFDVLLAGDEIDPILQPGDVVVDDPLPSEHTTHQLIFITEDADAAAGNTPFSLTFNAGFSTGTNLTHSAQVYTPTYVGSTHYGELTTATFHEDGAFTLFHTTWDENGREYFTRMDSWWEITPGSKLKIMPGFNVDNVKSGGTVQFYFSAQYLSAVYDTDSVNYSTVYFGDGGSNVYAGSLPPSSVSYTYTSGVGMYSPSLQIVMNSGKEAWITKFNSVYIVNSSSSIKASFTVESRRGYSPFNVLFDASSSETDGTITLYLWDFGDGAAGGGPTPSHVYTTQGVYTVSLRVIDNLGQEDTVIYRNYIYVDNKLLYPGDNGVYLKFKFQPIGIPWGQAAPNKMYIGARSLVGDESERFVPYIPVYNKTSGNPSGVGVGRSGNTSDIVENVKSYTGYVYERIMDPVEDPAVGEEEIFVSFYFGPSAYKRYRGSYRVFMRVTSDTAMWKGHVYFSAGIKSVTPTFGTTSALNRTRRVSDALNPNFVTLLDLGSITIGGDLAITQNLDVFWKINGSKLSQKIWMYDLVLIPQDEWFTEISFQNYNFQYGQVHELSVGSITYDGRVEAEITKSPEGVPGFLPIVEAKPSTIPGKPLATLGKDMRFTILSSRYDSNTPIYIPEYPVQYSDFTIFYELSGVSKVNRFFSFRGPR